MILLLDRGMDLDEWNEIVTTFLNSTEFRSVTIVMRVSSSLTLIGAAYIIQDILKDATRRKATKDRIILVMSICDALTAILDGIPNNMVAPRESGIPGAIGNSTTCTISGFSAEWLFNSSAAYNVTLAICYLLIVRYEWPDARLGKLEPYFLSLPMVYSLSFSIPGLVYQTYNEDGLTGCPHSPAPVGCNWGGPVECTRGTKDLFLYTTPVRLSIILTMSGIIVFCMLMMFLKVLQRERSNDRFRFSLASASSHRRNLSNMMKNQGLWYSAAFLLAFLPNTVGLFRRTDTAPNWWYLNTSFFFLHSVGFINMIIYIRPRYVKFRRDYPDVGVISSLWHTFARTRPAAQDRDMTTILESSQSPPSVMMSAPATSMGDNNSSLFVASSPQRSEKFPIASVGEHEEGLVEDMSKGGSYREGAFDSPTRKKEDSNEDGSYE